ncbi:polyprotein [Rhynchospora pubera]|uniref:Polyprotein n=1 Tax=Rhynchospora pubera TaxID=906938 RepID=A0AAV8DZN7_9POAL|nr:polyprotein [Rhynchospora pubera]
MSIIVADGDKMQCNLECKGFKWTLQNHEFQFDLKVMDMEAYEMLLGGDWMRHVGPVLLDFENLTLSLRMNGKKLKFQGVGKKATVSVIVGQELEPEMQKGELCFITQPYLLPAKHQSVILPKPLHNLVEQYQDLFQEPKELPPPRNHDHGIPIKEGSDPVNLRPHRYSHAQTEEIEKIVEELLNTSIIRPSSSPFSSPALLVKKKDGTWRMCIDNRKLNSITIKNKYPIPIVDDLFDELKGAQIFSKINLRSGYHQIRVKEEDIYKKAFRIHCGHFEFKVMSFGLTNALASFQNLMNDVFKDELRKSVLVFFDDILVYSRSLIEHIQHLEKVFIKLREHKLYAKMSKCGFGMEQVEYLGHIISKDGVATDPSKIEVMVNWPRPRTLKELRGFLGLTGYYRKFIKSYGTISKPLTGQLKKNGFIWNESAERAFEKLKRAMTSAPILALPDFTKSFTLETDACDIGVGAVLSQEGRPIAYLSKRHYLQGNPFIIKTDHPSLKHLLEQKLNHHLQHKALTKFIGLDYTIQYKKGKHNLVPDILSRTMQPCLKSENDITKLNTISRTQIQPYWEEKVKGSYEGDSMAHRMLTELKEEIHLGDWSYQEGLLKKKNKWYVGSHGTVRQKIVTEFHSSTIGGHSGMQATYQRIKRHFYWQGLKKKVCDFEQGTTLAYSTAYHPQTDRQTERVNQCLESYLRCMTSENPKQWCRWLSLAEYWYNTSYHTSLQYTPFEALYGYQPPHMELGDPPITSTEPLDLGGAIRDLQGGARSYSRQEDSETRKRNRESKSRFFGRTCLNQMRRGRICHSSRTLIRNLILVGKNQLRRRHCCV